MRIKKIRKVSYQVDKVVIFYADGTIEEKKRTPILDAMLETALATQDDVSNLKDIS